MTQSAPLCDRCLEFHAISQSLDGWGMTSKWRRHHESVAALQASIASCGFCLQIWTYYAKHQDEWLLQDEEFRLQLPSPAVEIDEKLEVHPNDFDQFRPGTYYRCFASYDFGSKDTVSLEFEYSHGASLKSQRGRCGGWGCMYHFMDKEAVRQVFDFRDEQSTHRQQSSVPKHGSSTASSETLYQIRDWLNRCRNSHILCNLVCRSARPWNAAGDFNSWKPTRLLDVSNLEKIRLCLRESVPASSEYLTLSHCWGGIKPLTLTANTVVRNCKEGIAFTALPKTFQDAADITRRLGFSYLWIDSLCIIQDSEDDWNSEAALMEKVYRNSTFTIAAAAAENSHGGCYSARNDIPFAPIDIKLRNVGRQGEVKYLVRLQNLFDEQSWIKTTPLLKRAWVFQERYLSTRIVHFTNQIIHWECVSLWASEVSPSGTPSPDKLSPTMDSWFNPASLKFLAKNAWDDLVTSYTKTELTFRSDKLVAFSGVAKAIQLTLADSFGGGRPKYLAGLWVHPRISLPHQLLWRVSSLHQIDNHRPDSDSTYVAPSWSWASPTVPVGPCIGLRSVSQPEYSQIADILHYSVTTVTDDVFSKVTDGILTLRSPLWKCKHKAWNADSLIFQTNEWRTDSDTYWLPILFEWTSLRFSEIRCLVIVPLDTPGIYRRVGVDALIPTELDQPEMCSREKLSLAETLGRIWEAGKLIPLEKHPSCKRMTKIEQPLHHSVEYKYTIDLI